MRRRTGRRDIASSARILAHAAVAMCVAAALAGDDSPMRKAESDAWRDRWDACKPLAQDGSPACVKVLVRLARLDTDTLVRDEAVAVCRYLATDEAVDLLAGEVEHSMPLGRRNLVAGLARTRRTRALDALLRVARGDVDPWVRSEAVEGTRYFAPDPLVLDICRAGAQAHDTMVRAAAVEAAGRLPNGDGRDVVVTAWSDADEGVRCAALAAMSAADAVPHLTDAAASKNWRMRAQCVDTALRCRTPECVDLLIAMTGDRVPRVAWASVRAVRFLTGRDFGTDPDIWRAWWKTNREKWTAPKGRPNDAAGKPADPKATHADFVGLPIETDRAVFALDDSSSMATPMAAGGTRAEAVCRELQRTLDALPDGFLANAVFFNHELHACWPAARPLTAKARRELVAFAASVKAEGRTDLLGGVLRALADDSIDTIYVLTDGVPTTGDVAGDVRVRSAVARANRTRKVAIHTVGFGVTKDDDHRFLVDLASDAGGRCIFR